MVYLGLFYAGIKRGMLCFLLFSVCLFIEAQRTDSLSLRLSKDNIDCVIKKMTLEEKVRLLVGTAKMPPLPPEPAPGAFRRPPFPDGADFSTFFTNGRICGAAGDSYSISRVGIPAITFADGPAGLRIDSIRENCPGQTFYATAFPVAILLASTWDKDLVYEVGKSMGEEVHEYGVDILLAPGVNIHRNPLTGRNFEYYSEDPVVAGEIAAALINGVQSNGVGTSIKHFAANNQEKYRNGINVIVSERALREIYLKVFEIAVRKASPWTVMSAYNKINGIYASELKALLTTVLREEWGFEGFVMTDWWGEHDPVAQMKAGNDLLMPGTEEQIQEIIEKVRTGNLSVEVLDRNVRNVLGVLVKTPTFNAYPFTNKPNLKQHAEMVRKAADDGMVLLKNEQAVLPIIRNNKVALLGNAAYDIIVGGTGSGFVNRAYKISLLEGMLDAQIDCDMTVARKYQQYSYNRRKYVTSYPYSKDKRHGSNGNCTHKSIKRLHRRCQTFIFTCGYTYNQSEYECYDISDYSAKQRITYRNIKIPGGQEVAECKDHRSKRRQYGGYIDQARNKLPYSEEYESCAYGYKPISVFINYLFHIIQTIRRHMPRLCYQAMFLHPTLRHQHLCRRR